jgi:hypothetical protein
MNYLKTRTCQILVWLAVLLLPLSFARGSTFAVKITPSGSGQVSWICDDPPGQGVFTGAGGSFSYTMNVSYIVLTFTPNTGGSIVKVTSDEGDETPYLFGPDLNMLSWFGPSENSKKITVTFSGGTSTVENPTGTFSFVFPTNSTVLAAIANISGNYVGQTPTSAKRNYTVDIAQDESGKVAGMGTVDGIIPSGGSPANNTISGNVGAISTINNEPTAQFKGKFTGTRDDVPVSTSGSSKGPVEISDIGSGTNGVTGTASFKSNFGGVPYSAKNQPLAIPVSPSTAANLHKQWDLQLSIQSKISPKTSKSYIGATAILTRPDGDVIIYPERVVKYSSKTGYSVAFKGGTNMTAVPNAPDKKSTVAIKGMTMTKQGLTWTPSGGTLSYAFLGQKGSGELLDFVAP